jgi:hypothetical protein
MIRHKVVKVDVCFDPFKMNGYSDEEVIEINGNKYKRVD